MKTGRERTTTLWATDKALLIAGVALVAASPLWWPWLLPLGWAALGLGLFAGVVESSGHAIPRPGRTPAASDQCQTLPRSSIGSKGWTSQDDSR